MLPFKKTATQEIQKDQANKSQGLDNGSIIRKHGQKHRKSKTHSVECLFQRDSDFIHKGRGMI